MADDDKNIYFHLADILVSDKHVPCSQVAMNHLKLGCFNFSNAEFSFNKLLGHMLVVKGFKIVSFL